MDLIVQKFKNLISRGINFEHKLQMQLPLTASDQLQNLQTMLFEAQLHSQVKNCIYSWIHFSRQWVVVST